MTQTANPVTLLASPLGEEGHEVAKGWTVVRMIMRYSYSMSYRPLRGKRLTTFCASLALLHPLLSLTHWIFRSHSAKCVRCASLRSEGRRLAVRTAMEHPINALLRTPFPASRDFAPVGSMSLDSRVAGLPYESSSFATSRGNEKIGGTGYCVTYDTDSQSRNADFISIARRAIRNPRGQRPRQTSQPSGRSPVNPHTEGVSKNLILSVRSRRRVFFRLFRLPRRRPGLPGGSRGGR